MCLMLLICVSHIDYTLVILLKAMVSNLFLRSVSKTAETSNSLLNDHYSHACVYNWLCVSHAIFVSPRSVFETLFTVVEFEPGKTLVSPC